MKRVERKRYTKPCVRTNSTLAVLTEGPRRTMIAGKMLVKELQKAVSELGEEMRGRPGLIDGIGYLKISVEVDGFRGNNYFECEGNLIRRMRRAYGIGDLEELNRIPLFVLAHSNEYERYRGKNSMSFVLPILGTNKTYPFGNETSGQHTQIIVNSFKWMIIERIAIDKLTEDGIDPSIIDKLKERGRFGVWSNIVDGMSPTFLVFLFREVESLDEDLEKIRDDILRSRGYKEALGKINGNDPTEHDLILLREAYRKEEFKRKDEIVELCKRAERIYELAARFYEGLKKYFPKTK